MDRRRAAGRTGRDHRSGIAVLLLPATVALALSLVVATAGPTKASVPIDPPPKPEPAHPAPAVSPGQAPAPPAGEAVPRDGVWRPRLVLVLVVDQFRTDYLDRLLPRFGPDGFRRLLRDGTFYTGCAYPYAFTETAPGHATLATGTTPDRHGIVANEWYDPALGRTTGAVEDPDSPLFGAPGTSGVSPKRLLVETLGDALRRETRGEAKVWAVAGKDRSAIFSAGLHPSGAVWYDKRNGRMVTSRYYATEPPEWLRRFNGARPAERILKNVPLEVKDFASLRMTPQFNDLLFQCARAVVASEGLGADDVPDLLVVGLSASDLLGHEVGPFGDRLADLIVRLDGQIAEFLKFLDARAGEGHTIVALSSDHGVSPTREQAIAAGLTPPTLDRKRLRQTMEEALAAAVKGGAPAPRIRGGSSTRLWFTDTDLSRAGMTRERAEEIAGQAAAGVEGIAGWVTPSRSTLDEGMTERFRLSRSPGRSPDLALVTAEFASGVSDDPATHGSPWPYDRRVPLLFAGPPFHHGGRDDQPCSPADLAPTLAAVLKIPPPTGATGRLLTSVLR